MPGVRRVSRLAPAALAAVLLPPLLRPAPASRPGRLPAPDSQELRAEAEERQRQLEETRRYSLETTWWRPVGGCDERVGRFCLWHSEGEDWEPPEEPEAVQEGRRRLLAYLDSAARRIPGDPWVAGQRVRYLLEGGRTGEALVAARACRASRWWCRGLEGLVHHRAGRFREAEEAFRGALGAMEAERACAWRDLADLLEGGLRGRRQGRRCGDASSLERRVWWLADPFYLVPGNDRRTEHYARWVLDRTQRDAETPSGVAWGEDLQELLIRYGWPTGWERDVTTDDPPVSVIGHYPPQGRRWMPAELEHARSPASVPAEGWRLDPPSPRSEYAPGYLRAFGRMRAQVVRLRRGDSALVVAAYGLDSTAGDADRARSDTIRIRGWVRAGLYLDAGPRGPTASATSRIQGLRGVLAVRAAAGGRLLSLEALAPADSVASRHRRGIRLRGAPEDGLALSDLMLVEATADTLPADLAAVRDRARAGRGYRPGERVGLYWELYGARGPAGRVRTSVSLEREGGGFLESLGDLLGLGGGEGPAVRAEWRERVPPGRGIRPRTLVVRLPGDLPDGEYTLRVSAALPAAEAASAERQIRVRRR